MDGYLRGLSQTKQKTKNYTGIQILPLFLHVLVRAQEYVQRPVARLKIVLKSFSSFYQSSSI